MLTTNHSLLKLKAKDAEDIQVISAVLQDAIAPVSDMLYRAEEQNFVMVVHRLKRESGDADGKLQRICCAMNLRGVTKAQMQGIDLSQQGLILDLLAVMPEGDAVDFIFAGQAKIRLHLADWAMVVEDFGAPWPAQCNPCHEGAASG
jgi:hypothetical protein